MRNFGNDNKGGDEIDFKSLEVNKNFKPENGGDSPEELETADPVEVPEVIVEDTPEETPETVPEETPEETPETTPEVVDESDTIFQTLSEKLGREITSYEDLITPEVVVPEIDPRVKAMDEWAKSTGRPIEDFFKYQKDYTGVTDEDIAREALQLEFPTFTPEEIEMELEELLPNEDDLDFEASKRALKLKKYALKGREVLEGLKKDLGEANLQAYPADVKEKIAYAEQISEGLKANQEQQKVYKEGINLASQKAEGLQLDLAEGLSIDYKVSPEDRKGLPKLLEEMPHWRTEDGGYNHAAIVKDAIKIQHFDEMIKLAYEQGLNSGADKVIKDTKNSTLGNVQQPDNNTGRKKPVIEGIDQLLGRQTIRTRF